MNDAPFFYPPVFWIAPVGLIFMVLGFLMGRNVLAALFMASVGLVIGWFAHGAFLEPQLEKWLQGQRVYAILFNDFPQDKQHFISDYMAGYNSGGDLGVQQKHEEEKIIMFEHHLPHYIEHAHSDTIAKYVYAHVMMISTLSRKNPALCNSYLGNSAYFANVWGAVGAAVYLPSIDYFPQMIVEAVDNPEPVAKGDQARAVALYAQMLKKIVDSGALSTTRTNTLCNSEYVQYYLLSQMPAKDAALILKLNLGENHLKEDPEKNILQKMLPF